MKTNLLMAVFNPLENDGRVMRAAETLSKDFNVIVFTPLSIKSCEKSSSVPYQIKYSFIKWKTLPTIIALTFFWFELIAYAIKIKTNFIYVHDFYLSLPGALISKIMGTIAIYDAHELIIPHFTKKMSLTEKFFYLLEKFSIKSFHLVISANKERAIYMKEHYKLKCTPISIRNISKSTIGTIPKNKIFEQFPILNKKNSFDKYIVYVGDISIKRGIEKIIDALDNLPNNVFLILIGNGPDLNFIKEKYELLIKDKKRIHILGQLPNIIIQDVICQCDIGIVTYGLDGLNNYYCSPNKIYEYAQSGLPVITTTQPPLVSIIEKYKIGSVAGLPGSASTSVDFANAIRSVFENYPEMVSCLNKFLESNTMQKEQESLLSNIRLLFKNKY